MLSAAEFKTACEKVVEKMRQLAPYDTGNLALNAIRLEMPSPSECRIYVDESIAPYMPFTNEPWVSPRWHGRKNPNEGWWQRVCEYAINEFKSILGGEVKEL